MSEPLSIVYATDEQIAVRAPGDFDKLVPAFQCLAYGKDGVMTSGDRWTISSALVDFEAAGVKSGMVVRLKKPVVFPDGANLFGVASVSGHDLTLRRIGISGIGSPIGPEVGATAVEFKIETLWPQIENATWNLNRMYAIDEATPSRSPSGLYNDRDLRYACELMVLAERYGEGCRTEGDFKVKLGMCNAQLSNILASLSVRWAAPSGDPVTPPSTRFSTRISR